MTSAQRMASVTSALCGATSAAAATILVASRSATENATHPVWETPPRCAEAMERPTPLSSTRSEMDQAGFLEIPCSHRGKSSFTLFHIIMSHQRVLHTNFYTFGLMTCSLNCDYCTYCGTNRSTYSCTNGRSYGRTYRGPNWHWNRHWHWANWSHWLWRLPCRQVQLR